MPARLVRLLVIAFLLAAPAVALPAVHEGSRPGAPRPRSVYASFIAGEIARALDYPEPVWVFRADVAAANAVFDGDERAIIYNPAFLDEAQSLAGTRWAAASIIAHEFGHHFYGHADLGAGRMPSGVRRTRELEADYFSGFALARLGASLEEAESAQRALFDAHSSPTHPDSARRLRAISLGWKDARRGRALRDDPGERLRSIPEEWPEEWHDAEPFDDAAPFPGEDPMLPFEPR